MKIFFLSHKSSEDLVKSYDDLADDEDFWDDDDANEELDDEEFLNEQLNAYNRTFTESFIDGVKNLPPPSDNLTRIQPTVKRLPIEPTGQPTNQILEIDWDLDPAEDKHKWHHKKKKKKHHHHKKKKVSLLTSFEVQSLKFNV